jgi:regulator of replication initiation timing
VTEELAVCTKEVEQLKKHLQSCDKEWRERLIAETNNWQDRLEEQQQDVETKQDNTIPATTSCWYNVGKEKSNSCNLQNDVLLHRSVRLQYELKNCVRKSGMK